MESSLWVKLTPTIVMLIGLWIAWHNYIRRPGAGGALRRDLPGGATGSCSNKWYFDELYDVLFVRPALWLGRLFWKGGDVGSSTGSARTARPMPSASATVDRPLQSGYLYSYALVMLLGLIGAATGRSGGRSEGARTISSSSAREDSGAWQLAA